MKLVYQYMAIFFNFSPTSSHLHPLQVENCDSNSRIVVDEDENGEFGLKRVKWPYLPKSDVNPFSPWIVVCGRQILTYKDGPCSERIKIFIITVDPNISIHMKRKELTKIFMMIEQNPLISMAETTYLFLSSPFVFVFQRGGWVSPPRCPPWETS